MDFLINYWWTVIIAIAVLVIAGTAIYQFIKLPTKAQLTKVQEWLLYAVIQAEKELGSGSGPIKLRFVYDLFLMKFPTVAKVITFEKFSYMVDMALNELQDMLEAKPRLKEVIGGIEDESN